MNSNSKLQTMNDFKKHFDIAGNFDLQFTTNDKGQLSVIWKDKVSPLTYGKKGRFYSKNTLRSKYGASLIRTLKLDQQPQKDLNVFISDFMKYHNITEEVKLSFYQENGVLYVKFNGKNIQLSGKKGRFYSKNTLRSKYGASLIKRLEQQPQKDLNAFISDFMKYHDITEEVNLSFYQENGVLYVKYNGKNIQLSWTKNNNKFYAKSFLQKQGKKFIEALNIKIPPKCKKAKSKSKVEKVKTEMLQEYLPPEEEPSAPTTLSFRMTEQAMRGFLVGYEMRVPDGHELEGDPMAFLNHVKLMIQRKLEEELQSKKSIKYQLTLKIIMRKENIADGTSQHETMYFNHGQIPVLNLDDIDLDEIFSIIIERLEKRVVRGSNWIIDRIESLYLNIANYQPLKGGSYIDLPKVLKSKTAIVNVKNRDDACLRWSLRSALFPAKNHVDRTSSYPTNDGLSFKGIDMPTPLSQIVKVEKMNKLAINVYGWDKRNTIIHRLSKQPINISRINLMLIEKEEGDNIRTHYTWIKSLSRLLYTQNKHRGKTYFCDSCLQPFSREDLLKEHKVNCLGHGNSGIRVELPTEFSVAEFLEENDKGDILVRWMDGTDSWELKSEIINLRKKSKKSVLKFENHHKQMKVPFVIYADFESLIRKLKIEEPLPNPNKSYTHKTQIHEACGFSYIVVRSDGFAQEPVVYRGQDATKVFLDYLQEEEEIIKEFLKHIVPLEMSEEQEKEFENAVNCHVCGFYLRDDRVRDHDHITGEYRGAAHNSCNLKLRIKPDNVVIPVILHNLRGYDSHLIMQSISKIEGKITCIPNNMEKYISFSLDNLRFIDSWQFMAASLDSLVKATDKNDFEITRKNEPDGSKRELLLRKGVYPYEYMDSWKRFQETQLPEQFRFFSWLTDEGISNEDYEHAQAVWNTFDCQNLGDYHDLYLLTDTLLLADVFENFRSMCLNQYKLDPAHYYTSPGLSWDALLKKSKVRLRLLTDYDMYLFVEKGLRGGISMSSKRYCKANNPMLSTFDPKKSTDYITYLDANNLYGWAMSQFLPTGGFEWIKDVKPETILNHSVDNEKGYICEVDLQYPEELHDEHNSYPLAPEKMKVNMEWLSDYQKELVENNSVLNVEKLVPNLRDKEKYVLHYRNLQLYVKLGMRVKKIHRVLCFDQSPWMESYIRMNTELRKKAKSTFEKNLYKLMNNSVFGKTMENVRKRVDVKLVRESEVTKLRKLIAKPSYHDRKIFDEELVAIHMKKPKLVLNKPIYVGMSILDLSKHLMYDFYYNQLKKQYGEKCDVLYSDTDSLLLCIETDDVYKDMERHIDLYDTSDFPKEHYLHNTKNKKVLGKFKDECNGKLISEYVGLRPKMYSILISECEESETIKKAKGVKKYVVKKHIQHNDYKQALFNKELFRHTMSMLRSYKHQIYGIRLNKISLSPLDTKRWIADDGVNTLAYGHYKIPLGGN